MIYKIEILLDSDEPLTGERVYASEMVRYFKWCAQEWVKAKPKELDDVKLKVKDVHIFKTKE